MKFYAFIGIFAAFALLAVAAEEVKDTATAATSPANSIASKIGPSPNDGSYKFSLIPTSYGAALVAGGAALVGVVALLAIAAVISPLFGFKLCQIFSTCESPAGSIGYSSDYPGYAASAPYNSGYQKRSLQYVGPIIQALNSAYEKYGQGANPMQGLNSKTNSD